MEGGCGKRTADRGFCLRNRGRRYPDRASQRVDSEFTIGGQSSGPLTLRLRSALVDIQRGAAPDPYGWVEEVA